MYQRHPLSAAFPSMSPEDQDALTTDIDEHGQREPITIYQDMVLDGWHRYQSCQMLEVTCLEKELDEDVDPVAFVISMNKHRRHTSQGQLAVAVVACNEWRKVGRPENNSATGAGLTTRELATQAGTGTRTIERAKVAVEAGLTDKVRDGEITLKKAAEMAKPPKAKPEPPPVKANNEPVSIPAGKILVDAEEYDLILEEAESTNKDLEIVQRILDADEPLAEAIKEIKSLKAQAVVDNARIDSLLIGKNEAEKSARAWKKKYEECDRKLTDLLIKEVGV